MGREVRRAPYRMVTFEKEVSLGRGPSRREEGHRERRGERRSGADFTEPRPLSARGEGAPRPCPSTPGNAPPALGLAYLATAPHPRSRAL